MREVQADGQKAVFFPSGKKAGSTLRFRRLEVGQAWSGFSDRPAYSDAQAMAHAISEAYTNGEVDRVVIVYNAFVSPLVQKVTVRDVLPIPQDLLERSAEEATGRGASAARPTSSTSRSPRRSSRGCCRSTSRPSSTARCSSRPPPSRGRA